LREPEDENEVEEELERSDPLLAFGVLLAHSRTLTRTDEREQHAQARRLAGDSAETSETGMRSDGRCRR
jgi:hypothetical protein